MTVTRTALIVAAAAALLTVGGCGVAGPATRSAAADPEARTRRPSALPRTIIASAEGFTPDDCVKPPHPAGACAFGLPVVDPARPCEDDSLGIAGTSYYRCFGSRWVEITRSELPVSTPAR